MTCVGISINLNTGSLKYINCGHPPPLLMTQNGLKSLSRSSGLLGDRNDVEMKIVKMDLEGQLDLLVYTDGIHEMRTQEGKNVERMLRKSLEKRTGLRSEFDSLRKRVEEESISDDVTLFSISLELRNESKKLAKHRAFRVPGSCIVGFNRLWKLGRVRESGYRSSATFRYSRRGRAFTFTVIGNIITETFWSFTKESIRFAFGCRSPH